MNTTNQLDKKTIVLRQIWHRVRNIYETGFCVSEHGLQALLSQELQQAFAGSGHQISIEPTWLFEVTNLDGKRYEAKKYPDLVLSHNKQITDVFEIKFAPQGYASAASDIEKLCFYAKNMSTPQPVKLIQNLGKWDETYSFASDCEFHFVAISKFDAEAVWTNSIMRYIPDWCPQSTLIRHWWGRTGATSSDENEWSVGIPGF